MSPFEWSAGLGIRNINAEENQENSDIMENIQEENKKIIDIRPDLTTQAIITDDNLDSSTSDDDMSSNIDQSNKDIYLQNIEKEELDIDNEERNSNIDENDEEIEYEQTYWLIDEDDDQPEEQRDEVSSVNYGMEDNLPYSFDNNEEAIPMLNSRPKRANAGKDVEQLEMRFDREHYSSIIHKRLLMLNEDCITEEN